MFLSFTDFGYHKVFYIECEVATLNFDNAPQKNKSGSQIGLLRERKEQCLGIVASQHNPCFVPLLVVNFVTTHVLQWSALFPLRTCDPTIKDNSDHSSSLKRWDKYFIHLIIQKMFPARNHFYMCISTSCIFCRLI